jgi:hypothetical protein
LNVRGRRRRAGGRREERVEEAEGREERGIRRCW